MNELLLLATEGGHVSPGHVAANLAVPIGLLIFSGSVYLLLWSNYGAKKAAAMYGTAFFGFTMMLGVFWWFGAPGTPVATGPQNFPGQPVNQYQPRWYPMEGGSDRAGLYESTNSYDNFQTVASYLGIPADQIETSDKGAYLSGQVGQAAETMLGDYLPSDDLGNSLIGAERRAGYMEVIEQADLSEDATRADPFFTAEVLETRVTEEDGLVLAAAKLQTYANFVDAEGVPLDPIPVDEDGTTWFAVADPGALWFPSAVWTFASMALFLASLAALDRFEQRDKRLRRKVEEPEDVAQPVAQ